MNGIWQDLRKATDEALRNLIFQCDDMAASCGNIAVQLENSAIANLCRFELERREALT